MGFFDWLNPTAPFEAMAWLVVQWILVAIVFLVGLSTIFAPRYFPRALGVLMVVGSGAYAWLYLM